MKVNYFFKVLILFALISYSFVFANGIVDTNTVLNASSTINTVVSTEAVVTTDQLDYPPGSTVYITGSGFTPGETVTLQVIHTLANGDNDTSAAHQPWDVQADADGNISSTWVVPLDQDELGATLKLTADGQTSSLHAEATFTDALDKILFNGASISGSTEICSGNSVELSLAISECIVNGSGSYSINSYLWQKSSDGTSWSDADGTNDGATYSASPASNTYYQCILDLSGSNDFCSGVIYVHSSSHYYYTTASFELTVNTAPSAPSAASPQSFCSADSPTVADLTATGTSLKWYNSSLVLQGSGYALSTGTYYVTQTDSGCESATTEVSVVVNTTPVVSCPTNFAVCNNDAAFALTGATPVGGTYSGAGVSSGNFDPAIAGVGLQNITYTYTDGNGCSNSCSFIISVLPNPSAPSAGNVTVCYDGNLHTGSATPPAFPPFGFSIVWYTTTDGTTTTTAPSGTSPGTYSAYAATRDNSFGCESATRTLVTVTINEQPSAPTLNEKIPNSASVCFGVGVSATFNDGTGGVGCTDDYVVSIDGGGDVAYIPGVTVGDTATTSIVIKGRRTGCDANAGCNGTSYEILASWTVNALPNNIGSGFTGGTICFGDDGVIKYNAVDTGFSSPHTIYYTDGNTTWSQVINSASETSFNVAVPPTSTTDYTLTKIVDGNGCERTSGFGDATATITVRSTPTGTISGTTTVCKGDASPDITFTKTTTGTGSLAIHVYTYKINNGPDMTAEGSGSTVTVPVSTTTPGDYEYTLVSVGYKTTPNCTTSASGSATVTVNEPPTAKTCPGDMTFYTSSVNCEGVANYTVDANGTAPITYTFEASGAGYQYGSGTGTGIQYAKGSWHVKVWASNVCASIPVLICEFDFNVVDNVDPTISCVGNQTKSTDAGVCTYTASGTEFDPTASDDNCPGETLSYSLSGANTTVGYVAASTLNGVAFNKGTTTVTWKVTDASSNIKTCSFDVVVNDNEDPTISCVSDPTRSTDVGVCTYTVVGTEFDPTTYGDNCSGSTIENDYNNSNTLAGAVFNKGTTTVVWTVTDASSNTATCSFDITVNDNETAITSHKINGNVVTTDKSLSIVYGCTTPEFSVTATGQGVLSYKWFVNNSNSNSGGTQVSIDPSSPSYMVPGVTDTGTYYYYAEVTSDCSTVISDVFKLTITQQLADAVNDGEVYYTGPSVAFTANENSSTATFTMSAFIKNSDDENCGDIATARLSFFYRTSGSGSWTKVPNGQDLPVNYVDPQNPSKGGTAAVIAQLNIGNGTCELYDILVTISGNYVGQDALSMDQISIMQPQPGGTISGGAKLTNTNSTGFVQGIYKADLGFYVNYSMKGKKAQNPKGKVNLTVKSYYDRFGNLTNTIHRYKITSNAIASLTVGSPSAEKATFTSKANIAEIINAETGELVPMEGNCTLVMDLEDLSGCQNNAEDKVGIVVYRNSGGIWYSNNFASNGTTVPTAIHSGCVWVSTSGLTTCEASYKAKVTSKENQEGLVNEEVFDGLKLVTWPNPSDNHFNLKLRSENILDKVEIQVFDINGRQVFHQIGSPNQEFRFGDSFESGLYFVNVLQGKSYKQVKLIKY